MLLSSFSLLSFLSLSYASSHHQLKPASVYLYPASDRHTHPPLLSPSEARSVLAEFFDVDIPYDLGSGAQVRLLNSISASKSLSQRFFGSQTRKFIISIGGVEKTTKKQDFKIDQSPELSTYLNLFGEFQSILEQGNEYHSTSLYRSGGSTIDVISPVEEWTEDRIYKEPSHSVFAYYFGDDRASHFTEDEEFVSEILALKSFVEGVHEFSHQTKTIIHLSSLENILEKYGSTSATYNIAAAIMKEVLVKFEQENVLMIYHPPSSHRAPHNFGAHLRKRQIVSSSSSSFSSEDECNTSTNNCTGHGSCTQVNQYWVCACGTTVEENDKGILTTYWGGSACEKKDISSQFFLFFWFFVVSISTLVFGIKKLYSIGEEDIGNVLTSGTVKPQ